MATARTVLRRTSSAARGSSYIYIRTLPLSGTAARAGARARRILQFASGAV